jgi:hypothetical protein
LPKVIFVVYIHVHYSIYVIYLWILKLYNARPCAHARLCMLFLTFTEVTTHDTAILDSRFTSNFLSATAPCSDKQAAQVTLNVNMHNCTTIQSSHTCELLLTDLPPQARKAHILPGLVHNSLISVGQLCDNGCNVTFTQEQATVSKNGKCVMYGS